jgi:hypothetical protein
MTDEQVGKIISEAMEHGFRDQLEKEAKGYGYKKKPMKKKGEEKTAAFGQMKNGILFGKYTPQDLIEHLAAQYGRPEPIEKEASKKTAREKLASYVEAELARPS